MYNKYLTIKKSKNNDGVFTGVQIPAKVPILEFTGDIIPRAKLNIPPAQFLQINKDSFIGPSGSIDDFVNHSCNPNCYISIVGNRAILYSLYIINKGSEITFDYSSSSTDTLDSWSMNCNCGYGKCRKVISGFNSLPEDIKNEYITKGILPIYITNPNFYSKKW